MRAGVRAESVVSLHKSNHTSVVNVGSASRGVWFGLCKLTTYQLVNALMSFGPTPTLGLRMRIMPCAKVGVSYTAKCASSQTGRG